MIGAMRSWPLALSVCALFAGTQAATGLAGRGRPRQRSAAPAHTAASAPAAASGRVAASARAVPSARAAASGRAAGGGRSVLIRWLPFGLSIEYPLLEKALGAGPCPGQALITTFRDLGSPSLRIGGDSQDLAGPSAAYHYFIPASFWTVLGCFARATKAHITVGLNFGDGAVRDNRVMIAAAKASIPASLLSFSLGNEPDRYGISHVLHNEPRFTVPAFRSPSWSASAYARQWIRRRAELGPIRLEGPDLAGDSWRAAVGQLLRAHPTNQIDAHLYPTTACPVGPAATPQRLLSKHASVDVVNERRWLLAAARAANRPAVISESNSASCGGMPRLSDTPVAGVWAVRFVLASLLAGFQQVRFHSAGTSYDPLVFAPDGTVTRRPLTCALLFMKRWLPIGSRIAGRRGSPSVFTATVTRGATTSIIVSSFASHTLDLPIRIEGSRKRLTTDTLTATSAVDARASLPVVAHKAQLKLAPNSIVALSYSSSDIPMAASC